MISQPTPEDTISILRGLKEKYEVHHGVRITDDALVAAATLSHRYISDRFLPDKAIDLVDEAAAKLKIEVSSKPEALDEIDRKIIQLQMERFSISRDDKDSPRLKVIDTQLESLQKEQTTLKKRWDDEKKLVNQLQDFKNELDKAHTQLEKAQRDFDYALASKLKFGTIPELREKLEKAEKQYEEEKLGSGSRLVRDVVSADDIALIVASWTGVPVTKLMQGEMQKLLHLQEDLDQRVIGQSQATKVVADAIQRSRAGLSDPLKPIASLAFLGPTGKLAFPVLCCSPLTYVLRTLFFFLLPPVSVVVGVGKTELCKQLAKNLFDSEDALVRIDMSEYMEQHSVARLIGAPPGYVGYEEGGQLTEAVRRKPYCVILFDEMEKAHPEVFNILLQLLDDGRLTDAKGNVVNFRNTICIFTSNIGSSEISLSGTKDPVKIRELVQNALRSKFRPEFLNRIDEFVTFNQLTMNELQPIVDLEMIKVQARLLDRKILLSLSESGKKWLAELGFDVTYGARPLKRTIQRYVENPISKGILSGIYKSGDTLTLDAKEGDSELTIQKVDGAKQLLRADPATVEAKVSAEGNSDVVASKI
jgi:ATP-dependent Clp protease ATP-binding subunit ClpB